MVVNTLSGRGVSSLEQWLPPWLAPGFLRFAMQRRAEVATLEEIRLRAGRPVALYGAGWWGFLSPTGLTSEARGLRTTSREEIAALVERLAERSLYAREHELARGFLTLPGGHRAGLAGRAVLVDGRVTTLRDWTGVNLRVARDVHGAGSAVRQALCAAVPDRPLPSLLLVGPPRSGKTTVLRDLVRQWSEAGWRVVVIDERSEIQGGGFADGFALGSHTDVLDGWPKPEGLNAAVRTMGPDLVVVDEVGGVDDVAALEWARRSGCAVLATAHAADRAEARRHPVVGAMLRNLVVDAVAELGADVTGAGKLMGLVRV